MIELAGYLGLVVVNVWIGLSVLCWVKDQIQDFRAFNKARQHDRP